MTGFQVIPPKQKYMTLRQIHDLYGTQPVVAYACKMQDGAPIGGYVIAVQTGDDGRNLRAYFQQFVAKFPARGPVYLLRVESFGEATPSGQPCTLFYYDGTVVKKALPTIEVTQSQSQRLVSLIPDDLLAALLSAAFKSDETMEKD